MHDVFLTMKSVSLACGLLLSIFLSVKFQACTPVEEKEESVLLAEVFDKRLYLSDVVSDSDRFENSSDSIAILRAVTEQWVRDALLLYEAEQNLPSDININALVEDYRSSLIIDNYEKSLVENQLDTVIFSQELTDYYEKNKEQYQLETTIIRCHFVKVKKPVPMRDSLRIWWDSEDAEQLQRLVRYSNQYAEGFMLEDETWYKVEEIASRLPQGTISQQNMRPGRSLRFTDDEYEYYLRILERVLNKEIAPLSYISEQASRFIMHKRKLDLLEKHREDLYSDGLRNNQIKIYLQ